MSVEQPHAVILSTHVASRSDIKQNHSWLQGIRSERAALSASSRAEIIVFRAVESSLKYFSLSQMSLSVVYHMASVFM
jgi:hypothetical protein